MRLALILTAFFMLPIAYAGEPAKLILREGSWMLQAERDILGRGTDTAVILKKDKEKWLITYEFTHFPGRGGLATLTREGPFEVTEEDGVMTIHRPNKQDRTTFKFENEQLVMPAFVSPKTGLWLFESPTESFRVVCKSDPAQTPLGAAEIPGVMLGNGFYVFEESMVQNPEMPVRSLRFLERMKSGALVERFRLVFDQYGNPRYVRILSNTERSMNDYQISVFVPRPN